MQQTVDASKRIKVNVIKDVICMKFLSDNGITLIKLNC